MVYPQVAALEYASNQDVVSRSDNQDDGYVTRVRRWLKQSF